MPELPDINLNLGATLSQLLALLLLLALIYAVARTVLGGISKALGRWGWIALIVLTLTGVISMTTWENVLGGAVEATHGAVMRLGARVLGTEDSGY